MRSTINTNTRSKRSQTELTENGIFARLRLLRSSPPTPCVEVDIMDLNVFADAIPPIRVSTSLICESSLGRVVSCDPLPTLDFDNPFHLAHRLHHLLQVRQVLHLHQRSAIHPPVDRV